MSYAPKRPGIGRSRRARIFAAHNGICWLCKLKIEVNDPWDADHMIAREIGGSDDDDNLAPAHKDCHKAKTKRDVVAIAKSNRIIRKANPETRKKSKRPIQSRGFDKSVKRRFGGKVVER